MSNKKNERFSNGREMYNYLTAGNDLYSKKLGMYVFHYNNAGALCCYRLNPEEVVEILKKKEGTDEYWGAYLGAGGSILEESEYNDDKHRYSVDEAMRNLYLQPSYDFCEEHFSCDDWMDTDDVTEEYVTAPVEEVTKKYYAITTSMLFEKTVLVPCDAVADIDEAKDLVDAGVEICSIVLLNENAVCETKVSPYAGENGIYELTAEDAALYHILDAENGGE